MERNNFKIGAFVVLITSPELKGIVIHQDSEYVSVKFDGMAASHPLRRKSLKHGTFSQYMFARKGHVGKWTAGEFYLRAGLVLSMYAGLVFGGTGISIPWYIAGYVIVTAIGAAMIYGAYKQFKKFQ